MALLCQSEPGKAQCTASRLEAGTVGRAGVRARAVLPRTIQERGQGQAYALPSRQHDRRGVRQRHRQRQARRLRFQGFRVSPGAAGRARSPRRAVPHPHKPYMTSTLVAPGYVQAGRRLMCIARCFSCRLKALRQHGHTVKCGFRQLVPQQSGR